MLFERTSHPNPFSASAVATSLSSPLVTGRRLAYIGWLGGGWSQFYLKQINHGHLYLFLFQALEHLLTVSLAPFFPVSSSFLFFLAFAIFLLSSYFSQLLLVPYLLTFLISFHFRCLLSSSFLSILFFVSHFLNPLIPSPPQIYPPMDEWTIKTPNPICRLFFQLTC